MAPSVVLVGLTRLARHLSAGTDPDRFEVPEGRLNTG